MTGSGNGENRYLPIGAYAIIGDCHTAALVSSLGAIDWYCPGRFDAPAIFCRLLDAGRGGYWSLAPLGSFRSERHYLGNTNVLQTTFTGDEGRLRVVDLMPVHPRQGGARQGYDVGTARRILRRVEAVDGDVTAGLLLKPTFDYSRAQPELSVVPGKGAIMAGAGQSLVLACPGIDLSTAGDGTLTAQIHLRAGERRWLALIDVDEATDAHAAFELGDCDDLLRETMSYWERWAANCAYHGPYKPAVVRSCLALKLLTYEPTGALVAAPTTSLPEEIGGIRNWDYRYTWLRDASLILYSLMTAGYQEEAADFFDWLCQSGKNDPNPGGQIMYTVTGGRELPERRVDVLAGYRGSQPVRVGNTAARQTQLDVFGEVLTAAYLHFRGAYRQEGNGSREVSVKRPLDDQTWEVLRRLIDHAAERWQVPDSGIWEVRDKQDRYLYSRLMCWAALDRGIRLARADKLPAPLERWQTTRDAIRQAILTEGYDASQGAFTQSLGGTALDAGALVIPKIGFLPPTDPRVRSTVQRIQSELTHNGLVYRYRTADGLPGSEGTFTLCTFWLVDNLALSGQLDEAHDLFEHTISYANDVGLMAEEIDAGNGEMLGNFPQGFTHMGLVSAAMNLAKAVKHGPEEQAENEAERAGKARPAAREGHTGRR